jgi:3-oxoadipate enol-lactonase
VDIQRDPDTRGDRSATLHFRRDGGGPPVLFLHPVGLDHTTWDGVAARLGDAFSVIRIDARGHGRSPAAGPAATLSDYAADVHAFIVEQGLAPVAVVGLSFGGMVAQMLAVDHPEDVSALVLAGCLSTLPADRRPMMADRGAAAEAGGMAAVVETTLERWFTPAGRAGADARAVEERLRSGDVAGWAAAWRAIAGLDVTPRLGEIRVPTLCIAGELDTATPPAGLEATSRGIESARYVCLRGAPHMMHLEAAGTFSDLVAEFLGEVLAARR